MGKQSSTSDTRNKILKAAMDLFSKNGFHATTTKAIARKARVNEVTLFRLFDSKRKLFDEILELVKEMGFDSNRLEGLNLAPEEAIRFVIDSFLATMEEHPREFRIMFHAMMEQVENVEEQFMRGHQARVLQYLAKSFAALPNKAVGGTPRNPTMHAQMLIATMIGLSSGRILARTLPIKQYSRKTICDYVADLFISS